MIFVLVDTEDKGKSLYSWKHRFNLGEKGFGEHSYIIAGIDADQRYYVRLLAQNQAGSYWTGKESIVNFIPVPDDLPSSLYFWYDANDLEGENIPQYLFQPEGLVVNTWKNKAEPDNPDQHLIPVQHSSLNSNNPSVSHDGFQGKLVVDFDGDDTLANNDSIHDDSSWRSRGFSVFAVSRYSGGKNGRVITSVDENWLIGHHAGVLGTYFFNGWVDQGYNMDQSFHIFEVLHQGLNDADEEDPEARVWNDAVPGSYFKGSANGSHDTKFLPGKLQFGAYELNRNGVTSYSQFSNCQVGEFLMFKDEIEEPDRLLIEGYLGHKWGIPYPFPIHGIKKDHHLEKLYTVG